ncbi:hypothetical protein [Demequina sp.]|uniref:hypothetical protein n=1 Tax=Demequina sp. TaxID=2050685 RepID=UPI0025C31E63|nr:hypothetical protein [Demequina sp.]
MDCSETPVWIGIENEPGVLAASCAKYAPVDAIGGTSALMEELESAVVAAYPTAVLVDQSCGTNSLQLEYALRTCSAEFTLDRESTSRLKVLAYVEATPEVIASLLERHNAKGELSLSDYAGVELTAWVAVAWGDPTGL